LLRPRGRGRGDGRSQLPAVVGPGIKRLPGAVDYRPRMHRTNRHLLVWGLLLAAACGTAPLPATLVAGGVGVAEHHRPPTGGLAPAGEQHALGRAMPLTMLLAPGGRSVVISSAGYREPGLDVVDLATGQVVQSLPQPAAFLGAAFSPDGRMLFASGAHQDVV